MRHDTQNPPSITAERFLALGQVATALMRELDKERLLHLIAQTACELTGAAFAAFSLRPVDEEGQSLGPAEGALFHLAAVVGVTPEQEALLRRMPLGGEGLLAAIFRQGVAVLVADALAHLPAASLSSSGPSKEREAAQQAARAYAHGHLRADALPSLGIPAGHPTSGSSRAKESAPPFSWSCRSWWRNMCESAPRAPHFPQESVGMVPKLLPSLAVLLAQGLLVELTNTGLLQVVHKANVGHGPL